MMLSLLDFLKDCHRSKLPRSSAQEYALQQTLRHNRHLNALREWRDAPIPVTAGPLSGVTVTAKDNIGVHEFQTYAGSAQPMPNKWNRTGSFVRHLQSLGAVITSKSHCAEFALGGSGYNPNQGTPVNPWSTAGTPLVPGGSSSGTAVAVASGMAMLGIGTDTGGSVRVPAALCGCVGFKASKGHWSLDGIVPLLERSDTLGLISQNLDDLIYAVGVIDDVDPIELAPLAGLKFALWPDSLLNDCDTDRYNCFSNLSTALLKSGSQVVSAGLDVISTADQALKNGHNTAAAELYRFISAELPQHRHILNPQVDSLVTAHGSINDNALNSRHQQIIALAAHRESFFNGADIIMSPTTPIAPPPIAKLESTEGYERFSNGLLTYTVIGSVYGCCGISLPAGLDSNGLPMAIQLLARPGEEHHLLAVAKNVQSLLPSHTLPINI